MQMNNEAENEVVKQKLRKTQKDWIAHFNGKGEKMVSASDVYKVAKEGTKEIIESLRQDFQEDVLVTSTRIVYKDNLEAEVIHDFGSTVIDPKKSSLKIPRIAGSYDEKSEAYLQALFETKDSLSEIIKALGKIGESKPVRVWTPSESSRPCERAVGLCFGDGVFHVGGGSWFGGDGYGFSRGVTVASARQTRKKGGAA